MVGGRKEVFFSVLKERRAGHSKKEDVPLTGSRPLGKDCLSHQQMRDHWDSVAGEVGKDKGAGDGTCSHSGSFA